MIKLFRSTGLVAISLLAAALVSGAALAQQKVLKFIPQADLRILDPIATTAYITRNHGYMVYDTLFAMDEKFEVKPQMIDKHELSKDRLTYTFTLRDGLKFHDGQPVRAADCIASIDRWSKRDALGQKLAESTESWTAVNDKTFRLKLKKPFPLTLEALAKPSSNVPFIMPERVAKTDAFKNIEDATGSGPFKMVKEEWVPGSKVVYVKNTDYVPRKEPPSWASGGKVVKVDRVEWIYIPDSATAAAALNAGEADIWEQLPPDLIPVLAKNKDITVKNIDQLGSMGMIRFNFLHPPFNNVKMRQALLYMVNQQDYVIGIAGDPKNGHTVLFVFHLRHAAFVGSFGGTAERQARPREGEATRQGSGLQRREDRDHRRDRSADRARAIAADARNAEEDRSQRRDPGRRLGHADHAPRGQRAGRKRRLVDFPYLAGRSRHGQPGGELPDPRHGRESVVRLADRSQDGRVARSLVQRARCRELEDSGGCGPEAAFEFVPIIPTGQFILPTAYRSNISGLIIAPINLLWNVEKK